MEVLRFMLFFLGPHRNGFFIEIIDFFLYIFFLFFQVFVGSASEGLLMAGDKVVGINHQGSKFVF